MLTILSITIRIDNVVERQWVVALAEKEHRGADAAA
jgi:hypothetical protein